MLAFFLSQLLIEPYSLLRCSLVFFFLVFISFLFLLLLSSSALPYYAITECFSSPAPHISCVLWMLGHLEAGILAHSLFSTSHLSFKKKPTHCFWKIPTCIFLQKKILAFLCQLPEPTVAVLTGVSGWGRDRALPSWKGSAAGNIPPIRQHQKIPRGYSFLERQKPQIAAARQLHDAAAR